MNPFLKPMMIGLPQGASMGLSLFSRKPDGSEKDLLAVESEQGQTLAPSIRDSRFAPNLAFYQAGQIDSNIYGTQIPKNKYGREDEITQALIRVGALPSLIESSPKLHRGRPCIAGTGVTVRRIVGWHKQGLSAQEVASEYGHLTQAQIHAALAYYYSHYDEIEADLAAEEAAIEKLMQQQD